MDDPRPVASDKTALPEIDPKDIKTFAEGGVITATDALILASVAIILVGLLAWFVKAGIGVP